MIAESTPALCLIRWRWSLQWERDPLTLRSLSLSHRHVGSTAFGPACQ
uniref:Uncharacterized protein n=1 Tax=Setaria italica TaxID=4555 RepID=K3Y488_SETIT